METDWAWRLPFTLQWIWIPPLFAIVWLCPESPWWLVRKGRNEDALRALQRLADPVRYTEDDAAATVSMMVHTTEMERQTTAGARYIDCFRGVDRRRTEISMMAFGMQITSGQGLVGQGVQFLQTAGISTDLAYSLNIIMNAMFVIGTMCSWVLLSVAGRRTLYSGGMFCMAATLVIIGGLSFNRDNPKTMAIGSLLIFLNFLYNSTLGPITYTIIGEMSSTRLRGKSIVLARITYKAVNIVNGIILPRMLSPKAWNLGPKCGLVYAGTATLSFLYCLLRLPETR
jgi:SP family general alpha glucoside:H+ symporter-like MFS transporter